MSRNNKNKLKQIKSVETAQENLGSSAETPKSEMTTVLELASSVNKHEERIKNLEKDINNPEWVQKLVHSQLSQSHIIKFILIIFLIILLFSTLLFYILIIFKINNLITIFEYIKNDKVLNIDSKLMDSFNQLFYETKITVNFIAYILGGITTVGILGILLKKLLEKFIENLSIKK
ncbi:MAG: hypothetical protein Q8N37_01970 [bacterium]|nr:hypothetical protein [bacterium]